MPRAGTVLVLTDRYDTTADYVVDELDRRERPVFRCDLGQFPSSLVVTARFQDRWTGGLRLGDRSIALHDIGCAYYRRPTMPQFASTLTDGERHWARREAQRGLGGLLATLPKWLNSPQNIARAEYKPLQLAAAASAGLDTPVSLVTNDPEEARRFVGSVRPAVYKPLSGAGVTEGSTYRLVYANVVEADQLDDEVRGTLHLFQAWVPKDHEVRLTVVDDARFAVRIDSASAAGHQDWRSDYPSLTYTVTDVPADVVQAVQRLMVVLGLRFGALDFVVGPDGAWTFLELNANGQWAWLQDATGLPIASAIADALTRTTR